MQLRAYKVVRKVEETPMFTSIYLGPVDDRALQRFHAGQHLKFHIPEVGERAYALSSFSAEPRIYRITVGHPGPSKSEGKHGSSYWLSTTDGDKVQASGPTGGFHLPQMLINPLTFISAGIGEAPIAAIAEELAIRAPRHSLKFFHSTVRGTTFALKGKLNSLRADLPNASFRTWYSHPASTDREGRDFDQRGEMEIEYLRRTTAGAEDEFFICGPDDFVDRVLAGLEAWGIAPARLHAERLGGRQNEELAELTENEIPLPPLKPRQVLFKRSGKTATWTPEAGSLLDFAEALGLELPYSCRTGMCGKCVQQVKRGETAKIRKTVARIRPGQELLCSSVPISDLEIDL
jgi:uncharacterized protein